MKLKTKMIIEGAKTAVNHGPEKVKDIVSKSKELTDKQILSILDTCYDKALEGIPNVSSSVDELYMKYKDQSIDTFIKNQKLKCGSSGFISSFGGIVTLPVSLPANISSNIYIQLRMVATIAKIGGYDIKDDIVQLLCYGCLTGSSMKKVLKKVHMSYNNINLDYLRNHQVEFLNEIEYRLLEKYKSKGIVGISKAIPVAGGIVGGSSDYLDTGTVGKNAKKVFL